jgi:predicted dehydrogenase
MANIGFLGAGGIARAHAYALNALKYYYEDSASVEFVSVASARDKSRKGFAEKYGFSRSEDTESFCSATDIDTVYILGPNSVHFEHLKLALSMSGVKRIYLEKPVCASEPEESEIKKIASQLPQEVGIQVGFQYLFTPAIREALAFFKSGILGKPFHFDLKYYHGDYLQASYRAKRKTRLTPAPDGGAMADLGSHGISLLMAFFGEELQVLGALQAGGFDDVPNDSDLFSSLSLIEPSTSAVGTISASRVSSGTGDLVKLEIYCNKGALKYSSHHADAFEYYLEQNGLWVTRPVGSHYKPVTSFPSGHVPPGWLRAMVHAHYLFLGGKDEKAFIPTLKHGLAVQRIVRETAVHLAKFRSTAL